MRCVNIDWLEVYCLEDASEYPCNADYFRNHGYFVLEREYGTRQYREMFTILDKDDEPMIEIRRNPVAAEEARYNIRGVFSPQSCHIRVTNRYCYQNPVNLLADFLHRHRYSLSRIFRLDICLDFERFDRGDDPAKFLQRYLRGKFAKINQCDIASHGTDLWDGQVWNSVSWGAPKSMVSTKFYNKTLELTQKKDKPYIRYAWMMAGLVDDYTDLTKFDRKKGTLYHPTIWRVEFSLRSSAKAWVYLEENGKHVQHEHALDTYDTPEKLLHRFECLADHYFHFRYRQQGKSKYDCPRKELFRFTSDEPCLHLDRLLTSRPNPTSYHTLRDRLLTYRETHFDPKLRQAIDIILEDIQHQLVSVSLPSFSRSEVLLLQSLISMRIKGSEHTLSEDISYIKEMIQLSGDLFA